MSPKTKLKKPNEEESDDSYSSDSSEDNDDYSANEVIQVEFEGRNPMTSDFHGVRQLLQQLFLKSDINLSELADTITDQNFIGSVVIQSFLGEDDDDSDDDENFESDTIFGITSAVNVSKTQSTGCIDDLRKYLLAKCEQFATPTVKQHFQRILNDDNAQSALIINERFINIPAQISVPLLESLSSEIQQASAKKEKFRINHYIMIVKFSRPKTPLKSRIFTQMEKKKFWMNMPTLVSNLVPKLKPTRRYRANGLRKMVHLCRIVKSLSSKHRNFLS